MRSIVYAPIIIHSQFIPAFFSESAPQKGQEWTSIIDDYQNIIVPGVASISFDVHRFLRELNWSRWPGFTHWQHPSFFAYFPTTSTANPDFNHDVRLEVRPKLRELLGSLPDLTVVCEPRLHRVRGNSHGLGSQDVTTTQHLLECKRGWWRGYPSQILFFSCTSTGSILPPIYSPVEYSV